MVQTQAFINKYRVDELAKNNHKKPELKEDLLKIELAIQ